jgi:WD40 repeat protein
MIASEAGVAVSPDAALAVSAAEDGTLKLWPADQWTTDGQPYGAPLRVLAGRPGRRTLAFSRDHQLLADATEDGTVMVWDTQTGAKRATLRQARGRTTRLVFSEDGRILASLDEGGAARTWDAATGRELARADASGKKTLAMDLTPDGSRIVTGDADGAITVWNAASGERILGLPVRTQPIQEIRFCGNDWVAVRLPAALTLWDATTGQQARSVEGLSRVFVGAFACDPAGHRVAVAGMGPEVKIIDIESGRELATLPDTPAVASLEFSSDGLLVLARTPLDTAEVWETYAGGDLAVLPAPEGTGAVAISPDGQSVATGIDKRGGLALWKVGAAGQLGAGNGSASALIGAWPKLHESAITALVFSSDGRRLATGDAHSQVKVWDVESLMVAGAVPTSPFNLPPSPYWADYKVQHLEFSPDGQFLAGVTPLVLPPHKPLTIWRIPLAESRDRPSALPIDDDRLPQWIMSVQFSPDSQQVALGERGGELQVRDVADGKLLYAFGGQDWGVEDLVYAPDGKRLASVNHEGAYSIWGLGNTEAGTGSAGRELLTVRGQDASYTTVAFTPQGERLITGSLDGSVRVWDATVGAELMTLARSGYSVTGFSLSADGRRLAVASDAIRIHLLRIEDLVEVAQRRAARALSGEERARYLHEPPASASPEPPTTAGPPPRPDRIVRAFVDSWNRMDAYAVSSLFAEKFSYSLDSAFGRGQYPVSSRNALTGAVVFFTQGERGRYTLEGCDAPAEDGKVGCRLTYTSDCIEALGYPPLRIAATFAFDGTKISMTTGEPLAEDLARVPDEYQQFIWSLKETPALANRLREMDESQGWRMEVSLEAGQIWREICQRYAAAHGY